MRFIQTADSTGEKMLNIGITTRAFGGMSVSETAQSISEGGFSCTELCFVHEDLPGWTYNGFGSLKDYTTKRVRAAAEQFTSRGVTVVSLGMFTDLRNPDEKIRNQAIEYAKRYIEFASEAGIPYIASECGFTPGQRGVNAETYESDYQHLKETVRKICIIAKENGVQIAIEACVLDIIPSPRRLKTLIEELRSESNVQLGAMLDPANFLANSDEEDMFRYLNNDICYIHGKDRKINAAYGLNVGDGDIDWLKFMACYIRFADGKPFILEYCDKDNCLKIKKRSLDYYNSVSRAI